MMKCVLALVVLLHLCYSVKPNIKLNGEIIKGLEKLNKLYRVKVSITSPDMLRAPSIDMHANASSCVGVFLRELRHLLNNVTVHDDSRHILQRLEANLNALGEHQENDQECRMTQARNRLMPFKPYVTFLRTLNSSKKR